MGTDLIAVIEVTQGLDFESSDLSNIKACTDGHIFPPRTPYIQHALGLSLPQCSLSVSESAHPAIWSATALECSFGDRKTTMTPTLHHADRRRHHGYIYESLKDFISQRLQFLQTNPSPLAYVFSI